MHSMQFRLTLVAQRESATLTDALIARVRGVAAARLRGRMETTDAHG
jgi:hypothetical protein